MSENIEVFWRVSNLEWEITTGGVRKVFWEIVATDGILEGVHRGSTEFNPDPEDSSFIAIDNLKEEVAIDWVSNSILPAHYEIYENRALDNLKKQKLPPIVSGLPWEM